MIKNNKLPRFLSVFIFYSNIFLVLFSMNTEKHNRKCCIKSSYSRKWVLIKSAKDVKHFAGKVVVFVAGDNIDDPEIKFAYIENKPFLFECEENEFFKRGYFIRRLYKRGSIPRSPLFVSSDILQPWLFFRHPTKEEKEQVRKGILAGCLFFESASKKEHGLAMLNGCLALENYFRKKNHKLKKKKHKNN